MKMLTNSLKSKFTQLFTRLELPSGHLDLNEFEGLLYALVITPDVIQTNEWLPKVFNEHFPEYESLEQVNSTMEVLIDSYNHYNELRIKGRLTFPFELDAIDADTFAQIIAWGRGFLIGLRLRLPLWLSRVVAKELAIEDDPVANSFGVVKTLVDEEFDIKPMLAKFKQELGEQYSEEEIRQRMLVNMLEALPEAVKVLQDYGEHMESRRQHELDQAKQAKSSKIGRNDPCPCGSGKKYKKCCGLSGQDGYLH